MINSNRFAAAALAAFGAASAVPLALAQLDFAGVLDAFGVDAGDTSTAVRVIVGVSGVGTALVAALALLGVVLALTGAAVGRTLLIVAAVAGLVTATIFWIPQGLLIGAGAMLLGRDDGAGSAAPGAHPV